MVAVDTDMLAAVVVIGGIILFSVANRKEVIIQVPGDPTGAVPMQTDEWTVEEYEGKTKKVSFDDGQLGGQAERCQAIVKYMLQERLLMLKAMRYFDDNFQRAGGKNIAWLKETWPKEYQNLIVTRAYCVNREIEFKSLWFELNQWGEHAWLAANSDVARVPTDVIQRLDSYYRVDQRDLEQFTRDEINHAAYDIEAGVIQALEGQAKNFQEWQAQTMDEMARTGNQQGMDVMVDNDGHWLMQNPLEDGTIQYSQARNLTWRDFDGVQQSRTVYDQVNMPQHLMQARDNGKGWDNGGKGGFPDESDEKYEANDTQVYGGKPWMATDPKGQRAMTTRDAQDLFRVEKSNILRLDNSRDVSHMYNNPGYGMANGSGYQQNYAADDDPRNSNIDRGYGTVNASSIRPQDGIGQNPYQKETVVKMSKVGSGLRDIADIKEAVLKTVEFQTDNPNPVNEFDAAEVMELEPTTRQASATVNIKNTPAKAYVAIEQQSGLSGLTSPRGKRGRSDSSVMEPLASELGMGTTEKAAPKKPRTVEIQVAQPTTLEVRPGVNDGNP